MKWLCITLAAVPVLITLLVVLNQLFFLARRTLRRRRYVNRFGLDELARRLGVPVEQLTKLRVGYSERHIPKKRGGTRRLFVPSPELKHTQRLILRRLLARLRTHAAVTGFERGTSVVHNAQAHVRMSVVLRMDLLDFFSCTKQDRIRQYFLRIGWKPDAADLLVRLTTHEGGLPQGAPTSPRLSNLVNYTMDCQIEKHVARWNGVYTRYADDITISFPQDHPRHVRGIIQEIRRIVRAHGYEIHLRSKLRILRRHQQQRVCGLVVNEKVQLPRAKRRWLRAVEHRLRTTGECSLTPEQLAGWRAYQAMIAKQAATPSSKDDSSTA